MIEVATSVIQQRSIASAIAAVVKRGIKAMYVAGLPEESIGRSLIDSEDVKRGKRRRHVAVLSGRWLPLSSVMSVSLPASSSNRHPLLAAYILQLALHPLRTKALTTGALTFAQEVIASHLARVPARHPPKDAPVYAHALARARIDAKALKMGLYGLLVSAPLSHVLVGALQRAFAGRTSPRARLAQLLASNLVIAPIQTVAYLASMALINGATSVDQVIATVKAGFMTVIRVRTDG